MVAKYGHTLKKKHRLRATSKCFSRWSVVINTIVILDIVDRYKFFKHDVSGIGSVSVIRKLGK
jgi:hypothetical protein